MRSLASARRRRGGAGLAVAVSGLVLCSALAWTPATAAAPGKDGALAPETGSDSAIHPLAPGPVGVPSAEEATPQDLAPQVMENLELALLAFPASVGGLHYDAGTTTFTVQVVESALPEDRGLVYQAARAVVMDTPFIVEFEDAKHARAAAQRIADGIWANRDAWSKELGAPVALTYRNPDSGEVVVGVADKGVEERRIVDRFEVPVTVAYGEVIPQINNRRDDRQPWTGGNWLWSDDRGSGSNALCTAGFNWVRLADGLTYGSTARHCFYGFNNIWSWYHNGAPWATLAWTSGSPGGTYIDDSLWSAAPGTSWSPTVWVGPTSTDVQRPVVSSASAHQQTSGAVVALSAANSGLNVTTTWATANTTYGTLIVTHGTFCVGGDSGGPWLTTYSNGSVNAFGQHVGQLASYGDRCAYRPVHDISSKLGARLLLAP